MERFGQDIMLLERLAAGGMAEVYRAKQLGYGGFEKTVAVKRILPHYASSEEFKNMFRMEANLSGMLQHPNVVQVFTNGEHEGYLYLVMEFVDGRNLRQLLAKADKTKEKIPVELSCYMVAEAAKGLEYAHNFADEKTGQPMEVVHRDMSPQNIMLSYDGGVKIVDFGIAKAAARADVTRAGVLKGKFGYMSPEQAQGQKLDKRTDVFALGIILFEMLTQRRLFTTDDDLKTLQLVRECNVPRPSAYNPSISPTLDKIVKKALAKEKHERYASAGDLYADLLRFMNQSFPRFIPTDLAKFLKKIYAEEIVEERRKREKIAAEAPARVATPSGRSSSEDASPGKGRNKRDEDATHYDSDDKTQVSRVTDSNALPAAKGGNEVEAADLASTRVSPQAQAAPAPEEPSPFQPPEPMDLGDPAPLLATIDAGGDSLTAETRITGEHTNPQFGGKAPELFLQTPQTMTGGLPPPRSGVPNLDTARPLTLALNDGGGSRTSPTVKPLNMGAKYRPNRRIFLYGAALSALVAFLVFGPQESTGVRDDVTSVAVGTDTLAHEEPRSIASETPAPAPTEAAKIETPPAPAVETPAPAEPAPTNVAATPAPVVQDTPAPVVSRDTASTAAKLSGVDMAGRPKGYLKINSAPRATEIVLDDMPLRGSDGVPLQTPVSRFVLPVGKHTLRLRNPIFGVSWEQEIEVGEDRILDLNVTLK